MHARNSDRAAKPTTITGTLDARRSTGGIGRTRNRPASPGSLIETSRGTSVPGTIPGTLLSVAPGDSSGRKARHRSCEVLWVAHRTPLPGGTRQRRTNRMGVEECRTADSDESQEGVHEAVETPAAKHSTASDALNVPRALQ